MAQLIKSVPPLPMVDRGEFCSLNTDSAGERIIYCNGTNVIWRQLAPLLDGALSEKPEDIFCWRQHTRRTTCVAMSPNMQWVVSGDVGGAIRVWGAKGDHVLKNEYKLWDGAVKDASWSGDSTRIVAAGDGKEVRAVALIWDTGSKTGEVSGHTKQINSISFRSQRPFRIVTGGEDMLVAFHEGPPFKFKRSHSGHSNFVNSVRFSPDGEWIVSGGADSKLFLYTGKEGELDKEFTKPDGISGSIWSTAWAPDSSRVASAGGDRKVRVWSRETGAQLSEALAGTGSLHDMQVGISWPSATRIISVSLDGRILLWEVGADSKLTLTTTLDGTQGSLTALAWDAASGAIFRGGTDGSVAITLPGQPDKRMHIGKTVTHVLAHTGAYSAGPPEAVAIANDDIVRRYSLQSGEVLGEPVAVKEAMVGAGWLDVEETRLLVATTKGNMHAIGTGGVEWSKNGIAPRPPTAMTALPGKPGRAAVALAKPDGTVGGVESSQFDILLFGVADNTADGVSQQAVLSGHIHEVCSMKFSPSGEFLASADSGNKILVWKLATDGATLHISNWSFHTARVTSLDWMVGGRRLVSGSLDRHLYVWNVDSPDTRVHVADAHKGGVGAVAGCGEEQFASVGYDGFMLVHKLG